MNKNNSFVKAQNSTNSHSQPQAVSPSFPPSARDVKLGMRMRENLLHQQNLTSFNFFLHF